MRNLFNSPIGAQVAPLGVPKNILSAAAATLLAAGIGATAGAVNAGINSWQANLAENKSFNRQKELMDKQLEQSKDLHKSNLEESYRQELAVNSPSAQMARYREAGLNPYLIMQHEGNIGSAAVPSIGTPTAPSAPSVNQRQVIPMQGIDFGGLSNLLIASSQTKRNNAEAVSRLIQSLPELGKSLGWDNARSFALEMLGIYGVNGSQEERLIENSIRTQELSLQRSEMENEIVSLYGKDKAALVNQNLIFEGQKIVAEINRLYSEKKLNDQSVSELITRSVRNVAEASKLSADAETVNQLRQYVVKSADMQASMDAMDKIEMQADFVQRTEARSWQMSDEGRMSATAAQTVSDNPETNLVNKIIHAKDPARRGRRR